MTRLLRYTSILLIVVMACSKDNYLRLNVSGITSNYIPDYSSEKRFRSNEGDTIIIRQIYREDYYEKSDRDLSTGGSLPDLDFVELQRTRLVIGCDTPYLRFSYDLSTQYNSSLPTRAQDELTLTFEEEAGTAPVVMTFTYTDSLRCLSERCTFQDTFIVQLREFNDVYFTRRDSVSRNALYIGPDGLVGFKTSDNRIFELIP
ncbi:MAG TPA: hypothetical protein DCG19_02915 [Cryomorphaceae bacterium]|nr:hypothetical protein [Owenweeksia sp.]MBF99724.1 hypothetical protein [Owenweeksia sp.]HAD96327.1 hypothetical protein [Cryomorphaceae bacterium]HBF19212.1 hypothetical protein [Cryomorphaceae bacterium]HCQ15089.1 hypothetical protein [Cryomorphaceae bacterium]|tara:strand:+ start:154 stop:762 length:609 start_codon:yes stop_codon:yes gene_type:complete